MMCGFKEMSMKVNALIERTENGYYSIACDGKIQEFADRKTYEVSE